MAHIISCMADADLESGAPISYIAKPASPQPPNEPITSPTQSSSASGEKQPFAWRMHQPESRKYQLFPKGNQTAANKVLDPEQAFAHAMAQNPKTDKSDKLVAASNGLRIRIKEHNLTRRRKVSVPELGPMTTVQEVAMDSPTIPGRPPLHERSVSAPGQSWKQQNSQHLDISFLHSPIEEIILPPSNISAPRENRSPTPTKQPLSPKQLTPLVIPTQQGSLPRLAKQISLTRLRSGSTPVETQLRSARTDDSPRTRTPFTPLSSSSTQMTTSTLPTPISACITESRASPKPWEAPRATTPTQAMIERIGTPKTDEPRSANAVLYGHRRGVSESGSIMDRGRPKKRNDVRNNNGPLLKRADSKKRSQSAERRAFEQLPKGWKASEAPNALTPNEVSELYRQAVGQAARFEVLRKEDVEALSRELRHLDERTEYLRRTYTSLRAGRRNLHSRICQYLRSPRVAKFSHDSMLKQEEALAELDASIDDWVTKLEQAENRRTRVRQKLLEHVAAAATLQGTGAAAASESLQLAMGIRSPQQYNGVGNISTPPRSPTKVGFSAGTANSASTSPHRAAAHVPSTILEQPLVEEAAAIGDIKSPITTLSRRECESIRVYADSDVYALLADVESEFTKMNIAAESPTLSDTERQELHRARSHDLLCGSTKTSEEVTATDTPLSQSLPKETVKEPSAPTCPAASAETAEPIFLTNAVFRPSPPQRSLTAS
ncbi:hypothetical protein jhhlp_006321 [Lomentospora prolificans]|uniref:Up-regulated during septation protein 1 domain-containing protein n=1 Tax=Lomentospora prolificans TaxID=41688 RepID=A0A2N3N5J0_9PEZI|nr:hypothetical protein jhhlp_006321 [Lomentospora prolificans]